MTVVKGGVWLNTEDEILKAAVAKYGKNQWARISSLLVRKTPKQCKARWHEWLDPGIKKTEWSKEEDEKLLHLAKLMPTQWRTIAPIVGRTANQCLDRYQTLLDEAEQQENVELGLAGTGADGQAPTADSVRQLRPGEVDPYPENKPAKPDPIDMDEDEKEMLSEARARLANTQGKKAKRKAREKQLEESRRLSMLQKRRELKAAGINVKLIQKKKGQMDYNIDIPFEKKPALGFYDTTEEDIAAEAAKANMDIRTMDGKRRAQQEEEEIRKRQKKDKSASGPNAAAFSAAKAAQLQRLKEAEQLSKRKRLVLPNPQVSEGELEDIIKLGMAGENARGLVDENGNEASAGLLNEYSNLTTSTNIRTPRVAAGDDHIANEARNLLALTRTQSSLLGEENTPLRDSTGFDGVTPRRTVASTPNPMATPLRGTTPARPGSTSTRTPRDTLRINDPQSVSAPSTAELDRHKLLKEQLQAGFANLPKPKNDFELVLPEEVGAEVLPKVVETITEDASQRDQREQALRENEERKERARQSEVFQRGLPRPSDVNVQLFKTTASEMNGAEKLVYEEMIKLITHDATRFPVSGSARNPSELETLEDEILAAAREAITQEFNNLHIDLENFDNAWYDMHESTSILPGLDVYENDTEIAIQDLFEALSNRIMTDAQNGNKLEKKLKLTLGGYQARSRTLSQKSAEAYEAIEQGQIDFNCFQALKANEDITIEQRVEVCFTFVFPKTDEKALTREVDFLRREEEIGQRRYQELTQGHM
ncbi:Pre-mRNA-splicing factor cef1 [Neolecta irregularis DAH-3]|uniref:Pre-mRNA-splicing factor cef1 n=1 Tax=Neolecta irregularis (strain DAH-3) TaxID=1198029 RepID=A0A1U7LVL7_NEOID|nr:Pre-mRNA-splicing factor cef1 [Neolecta irregularis DAH-3]|eukprot:OLL26707.1 Pre-mRNA-splicing factor cef1 [Neolecta irregularis DAH-3]